MTAPNEFICDSSIGRLHGLRSGNTQGTKVLALHGWLDNAASFIPLSQHLPQLDLVMLDMPGHGHSAHLAPGAQYTHNNVIFAALDAANALGWDKFTLLGHSMGAGMSGLIAAAVPQRINQLIAIDILGALTDPIEKMVERLRKNIAGTLALADKSLRLFPDLEAPTRARMVANQLSEHAATLLVQRGMASVEGGYCWITDPRLTLPDIRLTEEQSRQLIQGIECPTCVIYANPAQPYLPDDVRRARAALLKNGQVHFIDGTHHLHMEKPAEVAEIIRSFLSTPA